MPKAFPRGRICWNELMTTDPKAAMAFYKTVVGWGTEEWEGDSSYAMWTAGDTPVGGLMALPDEARTDGDAAELGDVRRRAGRGCLRARSGGPGRAPVRRSRRTSRPWDVSRCSAILRERRLRCSARRPASRVTTGPPNPGSSAGTS